VHPPAPTEGSLQLRVELRDVDPTVWRRLLVPDGITMGDLAEILLLAMGWANSHLHLFDVGDEIYGAADEDAEDDEIDESTIIVSEALAHHDQFDLEYDLGDGWDHDVVIEERSASTVDYPYCLGGENACPPEDVGGPAGYEDFLDAIDDPSDEEHDRSLEWIGGSFDPGRFDIDIVNTALRRLASR
jgi:Plasmid pRiA4b ORF-3-like protein